MQSKHWLHVSRLFTAEVDHTWSFLKIGCPKMFSLSRFPTEYDHFLLRVLGVPNLEIPYMQPLIDLY